MTFEEMLDQVLAMLQRRGRVSYRAMMRQFTLDEAYLEDLKEAILFAHPQIIDEAGRGLVWIGDPGAIPQLTPVSPKPLEQPITPTPHVSQTAVPPFDPQTPDAERRQLTVLFCDLVDSTMLSSQLDPEELREVVRAYQETCAKVISRFEGHIAQYLGDGLLVYFGYPLAHEDDAQRAVRAGLGIVEAMRGLNTHLEQERRVHLAVRLGIHTGLVVVGEVGGGTRQEQLALGETPNLAARLQGIASPDTLVISAATLQLLGSFFACQSLGTPLLRGVAQPLEVYQVLYESTARSRLDAAGSTGLTPLVGREQEVRLLLERWAQVKDGLGQVVLLNGEAGIGKSRLVQMLTEHVAAEPQAWLTPCQCSPYYQNTALYPLIDLLERVALRFDREETPQQKLSKLEGLLVQYGLPLAETVPLFTSLLSLPLAANYAPLNVPPAQQKQKTLHALLTILLRIAAQQPLLFIMEDLHWVDPTTLELLSLLVDQGPTTRILALLTVRPGFSPPWTGRSHLTQVTVTRLPRRQAMEVIRQVAHGKVLPPEVVEQIVAKTDGVPLFVEELTKMVLESGLLQEREERYELTGPLPPLAIPTTLHDSLMARLDRLAIVKGLAQLGATLGREFSYALLQVVSPWDEGILQRGLQQLVEAEFLYQQGLPPQATYRFKHALIQDAAYQSLLRSTRQQHHQHIAQVLEAQFPDICETQPELLAHHYTEAGVMAQAIPYWQRAGERALQHSAHVEAISHLTKGLEILQALPETPEHTRQELSLQTALGPTLMATRGVAAPEVEQTYLRIQALSHHVEETPRGLWLFYYMRGEIETAHEFGAQLMEFGQRRQDPALLFEAHMVLGMTLFRLGEVLPARTHLEQGTALYDPTQHHAQAFLYAADPGVILLCYAARDLWLLGYPAQAVERSQAALTLAHELSHPFSQAYALTWTAFLQQLRRDRHAVQERVEAVSRLSTEQGFPFLAEAGTFLQGWVLTEQEQWDTGIAQMSQALAGPRVAGVDQGLPYWLALLAAAYGKSAQTEEGLALLSEALGVAHKAGGRYWEAELYRLKGVLLLHQLPPDATQAETWLSQALAIARRQQVKSWELRATLSLSRLWQQQGKQDEARELLTEVYGWFTEGFDTADLQEAQALLQELGSR